MLLYKQLKYNISLNKKYVCAQNIQCNLKYKEVKMKKIIKKSKWIILFVCLIFFLALAKDVFNKEIMQGDIIGYKIISTYLISDFATPIAKFITNFGGATILISLTILFFIFIKNI